MTMWRQHSTEARRKGEGDGTQKEEWERKSKQQAQWQVKEKERPQQVAGDSHQNKQKGDTKRTWWRRIISYVVAPASDDWPASDPACPSETCISCAFIFLICLWGCAAAFVIRALGICETIILGASSLSAAIGSLDVSELMLVLLLLVVFFGSNVVAVAAVLQ